MTRGYLFLFSDKMTAAKTVVTSPETLRKLLHRMTYHLLVTWIITAALSTTSANCNLHYQTRSCFQCLTRKYHSLWSQGQKSRAPRYGKQQISYPKTNLHQGFFIFKHQSPRTTADMANVPAFSEKHGHEYDNNRNRKAPGMNAAERGQKITKMKMEEAKLVEKQILTSLHTLKRTSRKRRGHVPTTELFPSVRHCNEAIATFGDAGDFKRALNLFMQMRKVSAMMRMSKGGSVFSSSNSQNLKDDRSEMKRDDAETFEKSRNSVQKSPIDLVSSPPKPNLVTYSTMMSRAVSLGKPRVALRLWNLMRNQPNFYTNVLSRKLRAGRIICEDAEQLMGRAGLQALEEDETVIVPDVICCNTLMNAYAKLGDNVMARSVLNSMLGANNDGEQKMLCHEGIPRTTPTVVTYNTLADACKVAGELGEALEVLQLMKHHASKTGEKPVVPDAMTYTILIATCARKSKQQQQSRDIRSGGERDPDMAFSLLDRMIYDGIKPNGVTYCALIDV